jgi:hypothetical protein
MTPAELDNRPRFDGHSGTYELYQVEVQDSLRETGFCVRYGVRAPRTGTRVAEVWASGFDRRDPSRAVTLKQSVPLELSRFERERLMVAIAGCELTHSGCRGEIKHGDQRLEWDLTWCEGDRLVHFPFAAMYAAPLPSSKVLTPHFDLRASGHYTIADRRFVLDKEPGRQAHFWGTARPERWIWAHVNTFREDPTAVFEGLTADARVGPIAAPRMTMFALRYRGTHYLLNRPGQALRSNESRSDTRSIPKRYFPIAKWIIGGGTDELRFRGELWADAACYAGIRYQDPDGSERIGYHTKVASARLELMVRDGTTWRVAETLSSDSAALEVGGREADPRVPVLV